jgi:hypothetical protein
MPATLSRTTRMPHGVTNASPKQTLGNAHFPDPTYAAIIALEYLNNGDLTALTLAGGGTLTQAASVLGGASALTSGAVAATPQTAVTPAAFQTNGKRMFLKWAGQLDSLLGTIQIGFFASASATAQGIYILSDTSGNLTLNVRNASGVTTVPFPTVCNLAAATNVELGLEIDTQGNVFAFWNPTTGDTNDNGLIGAVTAGVAPNPAMADGYVAAAYYQLNGALTGLFLPTVIMQAGFAVNPTTAAARTLQTNFFLAAQQR